MGPGEVLIPVVAIVMFYGWIPIAIWLYLRKKAQDRRLEHEERRAMLSLGKTPPDAEVARAHAERARFRAAGAVGVLIPVLMAGVALGTTLPLVLAFPGDSFLRLALLVVVWAVCGWVSATAISRSMAALHPPVFPPEGDVKVRAGGVSIPPPADNPSTAVKESPGAVREPARVDE